MASKSKKTVPAPETTTEAPVTLATNISYGDFAAVIADLSPTSTAYLLQYGFAKSLQDSVAGVKGAVAKASIEEFAAFCKEVDLPDDSEAEAVADAVVARRMGKRFDNILAGTVGTRGPAGPKASPIEKVMHAVALERIRAKAKAKSIKLPKGEALAELVAKYIAKSEADIRAEAEHRIASVGATSTDLDDLLND